MRTRRTVASFVGLMLLTAAVAGCTKPPPPTATLWGVYRVTGYVDGRTQAFVGLVPGTTISLQFALGEIPWRGGISGRACNQYGGEFTYTAEGAIAFGNLYSTDMACLSPEGVMDQETQYMSALRQATHWQRQGDELILASGEGRGRPLVRARLTST